MRRLTKLVALVMALIFMLSCVSLPAVAENGVSTQSDGEASFAKKKVVSILYDDSSSMHSVLVGGQYVDVYRYQYAEYSLQMFMSLLGSNDELMVMPMSHHNKACDCTGTCYLECKGYEVNLADEDREKQIDLFFDKLYGKEGNDYTDVYCWGTPAESVERAVEKLNARIEKNEYDPDTTEYWFIILSDGAFSGGDTTNVVRQAIQNETHLRTIYVGFDDGIGVSAPDLSGVSFGENVNFTGYKATTNNLVGVMQDIANQLSGRFDYAEKGGDYSISPSNKKELVIDLSSTEYAVASIAVLLQDCGAHLQSASYDKGSILLSQKSEIMAGPNIGIDSGYSVAVRGDGSSPYMQGGRITLTYDKEISPDNVTILIEPAIYIKVKVESKNENGEWVGVSRQDINSRMKQGDQVRVGYEVYDMVQNVIIPEDRVQSLFGSSNAEVSYSGNTGGALSMGTPFGLVTGNHTINVSVSFLDGKYTLRDAFACNVLDDPTAFRIDVVSQIHNIEHGERKTSTSYNVYYNGKLQGKSALESNFRIEAVATGPNNSTPPVTLDISSNGLVTATVDVTDGYPTGNHKMYFKVSLMETDEQGNKVESDIYRDNTQTFSYTDIDVDLKLGELGADGSLKLDMTQYQLEHNLPDKTESLKSFIITLSSGDSPVVISPSDLKITATVDGTDVSKYVQFDGTRIIYSPYISHFTISDDAVDTKTVEFKLSSSRYPNINGKGITGTLVISKTYYEIVAFNNGNTKIDRFDIDGSNAVFYFRLKRDGETLSLEETQSSLDSGLVKLSIPAVFGFISPAGIETTVEMIDGEATICCRVEKDWLPGLAGVASMFIFNGERTVQASFRNLDASNSVTFEPSGAWSYIWRVLLIIFIIHCIFYTIGFFNGRCQNMPSGYIVYIDASEGSTSRFRYMPINIKLKDRVLWHIVRFIPIPRKDRPFYYYNQPVPPGNGYYNFGFTDNFSFIFRGRQNVEVYPVMLQMQTDGGMKYETFKDSLLKNGHASSASVTYDEITSFAMQTGQPPVPARTETSCSGSAYGIYADNGKIKRVVVFVAKRRW